MDAAIRATVNLVPIARFPILYEHVGEHRAQTPEERAEHSQMKWEEIQEKRIDNIPEERKELRKTQWAQRDPK